MRNFRLGQVCLTRGVNDHAAEDSDFARFVFDSLRRHVHGDWGDLCPEDKQENEFSVENGYRLLSSYNGPRKIFIITEADRSSTTVLFPEEY